jgi:hypothetical protein
LLNLHNAVSGGYFITKLTANPDIWSAKAAGLPPAYIVSADTSLVPVIPDSWTFDLAPI